MSHPDEKDSYVDALDAVDTKSASSPDILAALVAEGECSAAFL